VDFRFDKQNIPARVESVEYDPNRTAFIGLVVYKDGEKRYMVLPKGVGAGREILISEKAPILPGNRLPLSALPPGTLVYNVSLSLEGKAALVRSAGSFAEIVAHDMGYTTLKLPSGEVRKIKSNSWASIGQVSNEEHNLVVIGKAGRSRLMGIRPTVRGSAMNPVDHPYGGGEGRTMRGTRRPKNKWGKGTRGVKTRNPNKYSSKFIISRRTKN
ncbi:MAG: 50S ribosomal protein L2, partial [bacterium]|nr:50S ribosomal protein L2 [bacterium]